MRYREAAMREFSDATFERLKAHAEPLVDTLDSVINRALDALETMPGKAVPAGGAARSLNPAAPPNLAHTTVRSIELCGRTLPPNETYWNTLLIATLREAAKLGLEPDSLKALLIANSVVGRKEDEGYRYFKDLGLSIQGQDSNAAWRATYHIARNLDLPLQVTFSWQNNSKAAFPGTDAVFTVGP
jgi:hypothetical protein